MARKLKVGSDERSCCRTALDEDGGVCLNGCGAKGWERLLHVLVDDLRFHGRESGYQRLGDLCLFIPDIAHRGVPRFDGLRMDQVRRPVSAPMPANATVTGAVETSVTQPSIPGRRPGYSAVAGGLAGAAAVLVERVRRVRVALVAAATR